MESKIKALFNDDIVNEACQRFGLIREQLVFIGGFQNFVYEYQKDNQPYILRFTHSSLRTIEGMKGELDWILYLSDHDLAVSRPIYSAKGHLFEIVHCNDSFFMVTSFVKAPGKRSNYPDCLNDVDLFKNCGRITGKMHKLAMTYNPINRRHEWRQNYYLLNLENFIPPTQALVMESCKNLISSIKNLRRDKESYGLIHGDINVGNFMVDHGVITLFDFDECQYSWYVEDIAIQLYYMVYVYGNDSIQERTLQCQLFMEHFINGYLQENNISSYWLEQMPLFLRLREIIVYVGMYRSLDMSNLNDWTRHFLTQSRARIENGISVIEGYF
ncbi:phosphotransferase [Cohnella sp. LGH]|uniref:phosphotransferase enzyme family protein n=1 Tax=Cohnella sp. LGH TaxID=1619153 RepID=UPI001ADCD2F7|nr:phosphotransferase [Cohnella sp. LGH]QTH43229.1 phosphotransferase [Cohnella sp. LGH]